MSPLSVGPKVAHLTTIDLSLRYLVMPQLLAARDLGGEAIGISASGPHVEELERAGIRHIPLHSSTRGMDILADVRAARELWAILRRERPEVLHTHNPKPGLYGRVLGRLARVPVVVNTVHGVYATPDDRWSKRLVVYALEAVASRFSDVELVQSAEDFALLTRWRITRPARTRLLGNGVDLARFDPSRFTESDRSQIRAEVGIDGDAIVVGMVGRLVAEKGYPELLAAAQRLDHSFVVVCVGPDDPEKGDALPRRMVEDAEKAGVRFLGMRTDVDRLYAAMDLFVLPSHREGFPRAAMEAAAMGLPVIATDIRGCREVVEDGVNGLLFPVGDVDALTAAVVDLGTDSARRRAMGRAAIRKAAERFDERKVVSTVMDAYAGAAAGKGLAWLAPQGAEVTTRSALRSDAAHLARLHLDAITTGFLPRLGRPFLRVLYRALIGWNDSVVVVADKGGVVGFVAGVADTGRFYRHFVIRHGLVAAVAAAPRLARPSLLRRAVETLRYGGGVDVAAELLSTAVDVSVRGQGIAHRLGDSFLAEMTGLGVSEVKVVVGADNSAAIALYESLGFVTAGTIEVHARETSLEMVWSPQ